VAAFFVEDNMPRKPKKPCAFPDCPNLTDGRFCEQHKQPENRRYNKYQRDPAINKRYDNQWKKIRDRYIKVNPLCELCQQSGRIIPAYIVHHIKELSDGGTHDESNLQSLCQSCHSIIHGFEKNQS
jgi:5-methylcytosine-specific restriction protein A